MGIDNLRHAQYDPSGIQIDDPQTLLRDLPGWTSEGSFIDMTTQSGSPIDTPKTILFGAGGTTSGGLISMDAGGIVTILKGGPFATKNRFRAGRTGAAGISQLFFYAEISTNGGASWIVLGNSVAFTLDAVADSQIFFDFAEFNLPAGTKLRQRFARSSTGSDYGDLIPLTPSAALTALLVPSAPSAQLTIYKLIGFPYA